MTSMRLSRAHAVAAVLAAALLLRAFRLGDWPLWLDESWSRWISGQDWEGLSDSATQLDTHPPFYYALLKLWRELAPSTNWGLRLPSLAAGLATVCATYWCACAIPRLKRTPWAAAFALALAALSPALIVASRQARPYALFALAFAAALWAALSLLRADDKDRPRYALWLAYLVALECTLWLHSLGPIFGAALAGGLFAAFAAEGSLRRHFRPFAAVHALAALAYLPCMAIILEQRRNWTTSWLRFSPFDVPDGLATGLAAPGFGALLIVALAALGARAMLRDAAERPAGVVLVAAAVGPAVAMLIVSIVSSPIFLPRTLVPSVAPLLLLAAAGLFAVRSEKLRPKLALACLALFAFVSSVSVVRPPEEQWDRLPAWLGSRMEPGEEIWLLPNELVLPLGYAGGAEGRAVLGVPAPFPAPTFSGPRPSGTRAVPGLTGEASAALVAAARKRGVRGVWLVSRMPLLFDPGSTLKRALGPQSLKSQETAFDPIIVEHFILRPAPAD